MLNLIRRRQCDCDSRKKLHMHIASHGDETGSDDARTLRISDDVKENSYTLDEYYTRPCYSTYSVACRTCIVYPLSNTTTHAVLTQYYIPAELCTMKYEKNRTAELNLHGHDRAPYGIRTHDRGVISTVLYQLS